MLEIEGLNVWLDLPNGKHIHAVQDVSIGVSDGERFGLIGESGCGKTTTVLSVMGLLPPTAILSGTVRFKGRNILVRGEKSARSYRWSDIAMVFQGSMNAFNPVKTVGYQIAEAITAHGVASRRAAKRRSAELLEMVGISAGRIDDYPHELSGGMRQRAALAMALSCDPKVLIADEPTTALDVMVQAQVLDVLVSLSQRLDLTLILVTHDIPLVSQVCDRAAVMYAGRVVEVGPTDDLYHRSRHPYTRMLFSAIPEVFGHKRVASIPGSPPRLDQPIVGCPFAPRCDKRFDPCLDVRPELVTVARSQSAACHLNESLNSV